MRLMRNIVLAIAALSMATLSWADNAGLAVKTRLQNTGHVLNAIMAAPDKGIPDAVLQQAQCIAIVPTLMKGGFIFGGEGGPGVASCRTAQGWSAPAFFTVAGGSWGLQIGLEDVNLVMVFLNDKGMERLMSSKFQMGAGASAAAGPIGRQASADTNWKLNTEILTYSRAKGVFAGVTLHGAVIRRDAPDMDAIYGPNATTRSVLTGRVTTPAIANPFIHAIRHAEHQAKMSE